MISVCSALAYHSNGVELEVEFHREVYPPAVKCATSAAKHRRREYTVKVLEIGVVKEICCVNANDKTKLVSRASGSRGVGHWRGRGGLRVGTYVLGPLCTGLPTPAVISLGRSTSGRKASEPEGPGYAEVYRE